MAACGSAAPTSTGVSSAGGNHSTNGGAGNGNNGAVGGSDFVIQNTGGAVAVVDGGRPPRCDDSGNCTCINIAEFGMTGSFGAVQGQDSSTAFQQWLNSKSNAHVDVYATRTPITADLLTNYDVIILQSLSNSTSYTQQTDYWTYSDDEVAAVKEWVQNKGGAIIALTGYYSGNDYEIAPTNQLISFSGLTFEGSDLIWDDDCPPNNSTAAHGGQTCYCSGGSIPITDWNSASPISKNVSSVGAFRGRSVKVAADANATVVATFHELHTGDYAGKTYDVAVAAQSGSGRVFAFGDEWITYNSQWDGSSLSVPAANYDNTYDPCYQQQPYKVFQIPQLWYNSLAWCAPMVACALKIDNPYIIVN